MKKVFISSMTTFFSLFLLFNVAQAQVFYDDSLPYEVRSIQGSASWIKDTASGDFVYDNGGTSSAHRALLYSADAHQSDDGFRLTVEYTTGSTVEVEGHNFSFGLISDETALSNYSGFNPFRANKTVFSIGANLTTDEDLTARGLNFTNGTERITLDESGTRAQFEAGVTTKVTIEIYRGGYWCYRINDVYEASGVLLNGIDLSKSYRVALYGQGDNGGRKSIQSIKLEKGYAAGERAAKLKGTWHPNVPMSQINDFKTAGSVYLGINSGATHSARHSVPHKLLESMSQGDVDANGKRINLVVPLWGDLSLDEPENDSFMKKLLAVKAAGFNVKIYSNSENFVGSNAAEYKVAVERWKKWCDTNTDAQAFINSQPYHTGVWNRKTQQYEVAYNDDGTEKYPNRKYMFCYAEYVLKDYSLRYGSFFDSWIFDSADDMRKNGDNATSGILEEQRIYQAFANACHAGNPDVPIAFNNGRSTTSYDGYPFAIPVHFEDFTFGHAFGGNTNHANKEGGTYDRNYQFVKRMVETNGYVHTGGNWTWDDKIVGNFHSKVATRSWNSGDTQAWTEEEFLQWNLEAVRAGGSMTWSGSKYEVDGKTVLRPWAYDLYKTLDEYLSSGPKAINFNSTDQVPSLQANSLSRAYHVSKKGADRNPGTKKFPFLTLAKAAETLQPGDICVVHAGTYRECFTPQNSGTFEKPIVLMAAEGEEVVISGMETINDWEKAGKGIFKADVSWDLGESNFVLIDGKMGFEARFPNKTNDDPLDIEGGTIIPEHESIHEAGEVLPNPLRFISGTQVPVQWTSHDLSDAKVWVLAHRKWSGWTAPVTAYDPEKQLIWFKEFKDSQIKNNYNPNYIQGTYGRGVYYMFGSKVLLDAPNEWYFDKKAHELHVIVDGQKKPAERQVEFRRREVAIDLSDKKYWEVSGFEIIGATVNMNNTENCTLDNCKITYPWHSIATHSARALNATSTGIVVIGKNNTIKNSEISYSAAAAVTMSGEGITLANNFIHHLNYLGSISTGGIMIRGMNHQIIYNTIHTSGRDILKFEAGGSVIAWNHMYDAGLICYDLGVLYSAGTDYRNTVIHHNLVHNDNWEHHPFNGIYFDNFTNNVVVHNNVIWGNIKTGVRSNRPGNYHQIFNNTTISIDNKWGPWLGPETQFGSSIINNYYIRPIMANDEVYQANNVNAFPFDTEKLVPTMAEPAKGFGKYGFPDYVGAFSTINENWTVNVGHNFNRTSIPSVNRELPFVRNYIKNGSFDWGRDRRGNLIDITQGVFWEKTGETELVYSPGFNHPHPDTRNSVYAISLLLKSDNAGINQTVKGLKSDFPYKVGVYVRPYENAEAIMSVQSSGVTKEVSSEKVATIEGWKLLVLAFRTGPEDTEVTVRIGKTGQGDVYLDNIGLVPDLGTAVMSAAPPKDKGFDATYAAQQQPEVFQLRPDDITTMIAKRGILTGTEKEDQAVWGFDSKDDNVIWIVNAPKEDDYAISVIFSVKEAVNMEVSCGDSVLRALSILQTWENRPFLWRQHFPGTLHLKAGLNNIRFRLPEGQAAKAPGVKSPRFASGVTEDFHLLSIELGTPAARKAQVERAMAIRGDASWMIDGKYGLFVHWSALSYPFYGDQPRAQWFQKSVEMFDVKVFADAVERTGAAWVNFTATHKGFYWPAPNAALDKILPGRTSKRDLLGEIIDELDRRGIRTLFYLHTGYNGYESEFRKASGATDKDRDRFSDNIAAILRDCSLRYGKKLCGFGYIDGALHFDYPLDPHYESWARAIKAGNPSAVVGFSSNRGPVVSPFSELTVTDGIGILRYPDPQLVGPGRQLGDVTTAWWCYMDGWFSGSPMNGQFRRGPKYSTDVYVDFFQRMAAAKIPVSINLLMTADVTDEHPIFNPECMAVMEEVRKAIRGK